MAKFKIGSWADLDSNVNARLGTNTVANSGGYTDKELGKFVKLAGESRYALCAAGDPIEGQVAAIEPATQDGYTFGTVATGGRLDAICDGLQATPGTGTIAVGDFVVCGTVVAAGTAMTSTTGPKVTKATNQPNVAFVSTVATADTAAAVKTKLDLALEAVADQIGNALFAWRVVSLGNAGAVGDTCVIERVCC